MIESISSSGTQQMSGMRTSILEKFDEDEDGELSSFELENLVSNISEKTGISLELDDFVAALDSNGSGTINAEELQGLKDVLGPPPDGPDGPEGPDGPNGPPPPPGGGGMFSDSDEDEDESGSISETELGDLLSDISENTGSSFDVADIMSQLDADGDGELDEEEISGLKDILGPPPEKPGTFAMKNGIHMENVADRYSDSALLADA